jgi:Fe-S cluster assembly protein SufD
MTEAPAEFLERTLARSLRLDDAIPASRGRRAAARAALHAGALPAGRIEHWKYTPIARFYDPSFADAETDTVPIAQPPLDVAAVATVRLRGGAPELDRADLPPGLGICRFTEADAAQRMLIEHWLDRDIDNERHPLNLVNLALLEDGLLVHVAAGTRIGRPLDLQALTGPRIAGCDRVLVLLERGSALTLVEQSASRRARNTVVELHVGDDATLTHYRVQQASEANAWQLVHVNVGANAQYRFRGYGFGGAPHRSELHVRLTGRGSDAELRGALVVRGREKLDHQLCVEHVAPGCRSRQQFHGIALDRGELTFNGRIHIHPDAQQSDARLSNRNLLGNDNARINTKPELEIYADDVQCAHGATVGQLSEAELFYLRSRGIPEATARTMLLRGFIGAVLPEEADAPPFDVLFDEVLQQWAR